MKCLPLIEPSPLPFSAARLKIYNTHASGLALKKFTLPEMIRHHKRIMLPQLALNVTEWTGTRSSDNLPVMLLIHGSGDATCVWDQAIENLVDRYKVMAVDLRGHGDSDWAPEGDYRVQTMAQDVADLIKAMAIDKMILVGHSLGGEVALHFAASCPNVLERVVLVDYGPQIQPLSAAHIRSVMRAAHRSYCNWQEYSMVLQERHPLAAPQLLDRIAQETTCRRETGEVRLKYDPALISKDTGPSPQSENESETSMLWQLLSAVHCPVLVMRGIASSVLTQRIAEKMVREVLSHATLSVVPAAGHSIQIDNPAGFKKTLEIFLSDRPE